MLYVNCTLSCVQPVFAFGVPGLGCGSGCWFLGAETRGSEEPCVSAGSECSGAPPLGASPRILSKKTEFTSPFASWSSPLGAWRDQELVCNISCSTGLEPLFLETFLLIELLRILLKINFTLSIYFFCMCWQVQDKSLPWRAPEHKRSHRVPQRSLEHFASDGVQRYKPLASSPACWNHPGRWCQRERWVFAGRTCTSRVLVAPFGDAAPLHR